MQNKQRLSKILALGGTVLVWFPLAAMILFSLAFLVRSGRFHFDYLMPAEFFPLALVGGILLTWAAYRRHLHRKLIFWSFGIAVAVLILGQALAVVTGLATGEIEPGGAAWVLVVASIVAYDVALGVLGVAGILLLRDLSSRPRLTIPAK